MIVDQVTDRLWTIEIIAWLQVPFIVVSGFAYEALVGRVIGRDVLDGKYMINLTPRGAAPDETVWVETNALAYWFKGVHGNWLILAAVVIFGSALLRHILSRRRHDE